MKPVAAALAALFAAVGTTSTFGGSLPVIDREAVVRRHNPDLKRVDALSPFSVGNGRFAFTADVTGLQTFPDTYDKGMPLHTESEWGWHTSPNPDGYRREDAVRNYDVSGRSVPYLEGGGDGQDYSPAVKWLRENPHRIDLGRMGLHIRLASGSTATIDDLQDIHQHLDLWTGLLESRFSIEGVPVLVRTACHPDQDTIAVEIESGLLKSGRLGVSMAFPGAAGGWKENVDWGHPDAHRTDSKNRPGRCDFSRTLDSTTYGARVEWSEGAEFQKSGPHQFLITAPGCDRLGITAAFSPHPIEGPLPVPKTLFKASVAHWQKFWKSGGAIDLSASTDPRWKELERRIVLSQYLTAINCAGTMPPQETGLVCNSWYGKFHLEMHWWHAAHFALWGRSELLERSLPWYQNILPVARANAERQGYRGARWPKMVDPDGQDSPSKVAVFLIWQQPHPIYYAELSYRAHGDKETLDRYRELVFETAEFMASYAAWDEKEKRYVLGPVLIPAQESYGKWRRTTLNPTFELTYWRWALETAQQWRQRLGMEREPKWDEVLKQLAKPTTRDGSYTAIETEPYTITEDHPSMLAALGLLPTEPGIDPQVMGRTLDSVLKTWDWKTTWGWDYPMMAMTAARLGRPEDAIKALLLDAPKNVYLSNGHNYQDERLPLYLPGNGGLLAAVAMMAAGWDGAATNDAPGFPKDGTWTVRQEGLKPMP